MKMVVKRTRKLLRVIGRFRGFLYFNIVVKLSKKGIVDFCNVYTALRTAIRKAGITDEFTYIA